MSSLTHSSYTFSPTNKTKLGEYASTASTNTISTMKSIKNKLDNTRTTHRTHIKKSTKSKQKIKKSVIGWCCFKTAKSPSIIHYPSSQNNTSEIVSQTKTKFPFPKTFNNPNIISNLQSPPNILSPPSTNLMLSSTATTKSSTNNKIKCIKSKNKPICVANNSYSHNINITNILTRRGYIRKQKIAPTLQGEVFVATSIRNKLLVYGFIKAITKTINYAISYDEICNICSVYFAENQAEDVVIKTADKILHSKGVTITETGIPLKVKENIVKEARLMEWFMSCNPPQQLIQYYDFFADHKNYYLVMQKGGIGLFEFTVKCHKLIHQNKLDIKEWRHIVRFIFSKMVAFINWMHSVVNACNLDISLENIVLSDDTYFDETTGTVKNLDIRFIDFGLSELFEKRKNPRFYCNKFVGKKGYKSPQVYGRKVFKADKADVWSLAVCLFMLSIGAPPYHRPVESDKRFTFIKHGKIIDLLTTWNRLHFIGKKQYDLMVKMLCFDEKDRLSIHDVMNHIWMKGYFNSKPMKVMNSFGYGPSTTLSITESNTFQCQSDYCVVEQ